VTIAGVWFGSDADERFKFDVYGDWSQNYGDDGGDGKLEEFGADIPITGGAGRYTISFDDQTKRYAVAKEPPS
jgi:hypothetical protein